MRVLVVGSGAREHALAWRLKQCDSVEWLAVAPGNPGMRGDCDALWEMTRLVDGKPAFEQLAEQALQAEVDLVVIGPDNALADGIVDVLSARGLCVFGPTQAAAQIESSKAFAKQVMQEACVPTARFFILNKLSDLEACLGAAPWISQTGGVVKADGLALGKGVRVCEDRASVREAAHALFAHSGRLVIEERLSGQEISWMALCDGEDCALLDPACDYKRVGDGDTGPNTGGMGAYSPVEQVSDEFRARVKQEVFIPVLREMKRLGTPFRGVLYAGLMVDFEAGKYWVLEFNARFGDPETQVLMPRIQGNFAKVLQRCAQGKAEPVEFSSSKAVYVVAAAPGYPDAPTVGAQVRLPEDGRYFTAGVRQSPHAKPGEWVTSGGRVCGALGLAETWGAARSSAYDGIKQVKCNKLYWRRDIAAGLK